MLNSNNVEVNSLWLTPDNSVHLKQVNQFVDWKQTGGVLWLDLQYKLFSDIEPFLQSINVHELAIKDASRLRHPPKVEVFDDWVFLLYRGVVSTNDDFEIAHQQVAFFFHENCLISIHPEPKPVLLEFMSSLDSAGAKKGPAFVLLKLLHKMSSIYLDHIFELESRLDELEDLIHTSGNDEHLAELTGYRSDLLRLRRTFNYHKALALELEQDKYLKQYTEHFEHEMSDLSERFERLHSLIELNYTVCGDLIESYLSVASHRMNITMKVLTIVSAVFVPLTFIAGIYGMNFENMPELKINNAYYVVLGVMGVVAVASIALFKWKKWF